jgi:hypothetical protein
MSITQEHDDPVLVRSGLRLDECITEICIAVKVMKRHASETLKMVRCVHNCETLVLLCQTHGSGPVPLSTSLRSHPSLQAGALL